MNIKNERLLYSLILIGLVFLAYSNVYLFTFLYDDELFIVKNTFLDSTQNILAIFSHSVTGGAGYSDSFYRPIQVFLYLVTNLLFGKSTEAFHFLNIFIHSLNAILVFLLAQRFRIPIKTAFIIAAIWALHPIHTECITYMSGTADSLHSFFMLLALVIMSPHFSNQRMLIGLGLFILALLSKEAAIAFPAILLSVMFYFSKEKWKPHSYLKTIPFWICAFGYLYLRKTVLNFDHDFSFFKTENIYTQNIFFRIYTFLATLPEYLRLLLWPQNLHIDRHFFVYTSFFEKHVLLGAFIFFISMGILILNFLKQERFQWAAWMVLWFAAAYGPLCGVLVPMNSLFLEHWMYTPSIAFFMGFGVLLNSTFQKSNKLRTVNCVIGILILLIFGTLTYRQNQNWQNPETLYTHILKLNPTVSRVRHNLAMFYSESKLYEKALEQYEIVIKTDGSYPQTYHNMGHLYLELGKVDLAENSFLKAIEISPRFFPSLGELAQIYEKKGNLLKANEYYKKYQDSLVK